MYIELGICLRIGHYYQNKTPRTLTFSKIEEHYETEVKIIYKLAFTKICFPNKTDVG